MEKRATIRCISTEILIGTDVHVLYLPFIGEREFSQKIKNANSFQSKSAYTYIPIYCKQLNILFSLEHLANNTCLTMLLKLVLLNLKALQKFQKPFKALKIFMPSKAEKLLAKHSMAFCPWKSLQQKHFPTLVFPKRTFKCNSCTKLGFFAKTSISRKYSTIPVAGAK